MIWSRRGSTSGADGLEGELSELLGEMALGLLEGSDIQVTRRAIGGDPIEVLVMGYALSLRRDEARLVEVVPA